MADVNEEMRLREELAEAQKLFAEWAKGSLSERLKADLAAATARATAAESEIASLKGSLASANDKALMRGRAAHEAQEKLRAAESALAEARGALEKSTARLTILRDRAEGCDALTDEQRRAQHGHKLTLFEVPAWIEEQRGILGRIDAALARAGEQAPIPEKQLSGSAEPASAHECGICHQTVECDPQGITFTHPASGGEGLRLRWFQRAGDGLWNAVCACGSDLVGWKKSDRAKAEAEHFKVADGGLRCGPHAPCPCCSTAAPAPGAGEREG